MVTPGLFEKIMNRVAEDPVALKRLLKERYERLNARLEQQLASQRMTDDVLNKRYTL